MEINIGDEVKGKRPVRVMDGDAVLFEHAADDVDHAHKLLKIGRKHGWDSDELAEATKAETKKENARIDAGKAKAEPKK